MLTFPLVGNNAIKSVLRVSSLNTLLMLSSCYIIGTGVWSLYEPSVKFATCYKREIEVNNLTLVHMVINMQVQTVGSTPLLIVMIIEVRLQ